MKIFITGATGYLGSYICTELLQQTAADLVLLIRAGSEEEAVEKFRQAMLLHLPDKEFNDLIKNRITFVPGDITQKNLGISDSVMECIVPGIESVIHCAAILNRRSETKCAKVNLKGTLEVITFAKRIAADHPLIRFSFISTATAAGKRSKEVISEDNAIEWDRDDYDPYSRTKKFCEHMVKELLAPHMPVTIFRPSAIIGDSRHNKTTQFDMLRPLGVCCRLSVMPFSGKGRLDIVSADFAAKAITAIHLKEDPEHTTYHISSGVDSPSLRDIIKTLKGPSAIMPTLFIPLLLKPFSLLIHCISISPRIFGLKKLGWLIRVYLPYVTYDTVFDNSRIVNELNISPASFLKYGKELFDWARKNGYQFRNTALK